MNPHKEKYFGMYQDLAVWVAQQSSAKRKQVGAVIISKSGMVALGLNGMPSGYHNDCELKDGTTNPLVIHAERNAIDKMTREGTTVSGSIIFTTLSPCLECAKSLAAVGITAIYYRDHHREDALEHLNQMGISTYQWKWKMNILEILTYAFITFGALYLLTENDYPNTNVRFAIKATKVLATAGFALALSFWAIA